MKRMLFLLFCVLNFSLYSQQEYKIRTVAFYNLENLFDTINDVSKNDELSPMMEIKSGRSKIYYDKLEKLSTVISQIGVEKATNAPVLLGVAEVENKQVLQDLVNTELLQKKNYEIIHLDSPDHRGIDVALLYQPRYFKPIHYEVFNPNIYVENKKIHTRDILWVKGFLDDEEIHLIINHWPSRRGGEAKSSPKREKAAYRVTQIIEKIRVGDNNAKILIMGDFNDDPTNKSFKEVLQTKGNLKVVKEGDIYNPYEKMFAKGFSTLSYRDNINLFDQILITSPFINSNKENDFTSYKMFKSAIFNKRFLIGKKGKFKGYPFRSFSGSTYTGGYSDHYPVYMYLIKEHHK